MWLFYRVLIVLILTSFCRAAGAEDDVLVLLKELKAQVGELKSQLDRSNARIEHLEKQLADYRGARLGDGSSVNTSESDPNRAMAESETEAVDTPLVSVGDVQGTYKIPGTDTSVGIGGYIKTDMILNSVGVGRDRLGEQQLLLAQIPVRGGDVEHGQLAFHAKESRLWFKSFTPSAWGNINTFIEMDFFGDPGAYTYTPRLRHAYGSIGNILAGQTWTTFLNVLAAPDHLDNGTSAGSIFMFRQPLLRWSQPFSFAGSAFEWQMAFEAPRSSIWDAALASANSDNPNAYPFFINSNDNRYPDLVARLNVVPEWGSLSIAALGRQIRYRDGEGALENTWAGAVSLAGKVNLFGLDNIRFMAHYGDGYGRYVTTLNTFSDGSVDDEGRLHLTTNYGGMLSYQHWWSGAWRSTLTYGISRAEQPDFVNRLLNRQVQSVHANLLWSPLSQVVMGIEYIYATRELRDDREGNLHRMQISARYNF
ncbi:MAG: DcaP family trimeric outer membrane transporter [Methylomicrobium sp.]